MRNARTITVMGLAAAIGVLIYVLDLSSVDLADWASGLRIALVVCAAVVAIIAYHAWSTRNTVHTICAMVLGLLGGAAVVSAVSTSTGDDVYGHGPMAFVGTVALVLSVVVSQVGTLRLTEENR